MYVPVHKRASSKGNICDSDLASVSSSSSWGFGPGSSAPTTPMTSSPALSRLELQDSEEPEGKWHAPVPQTAISNSFTAPTIPPQPLIYTRDELLHLARSPLTWLPRRLLAQLQREFPYCVMSRERRRALVSTHPGWKVVTTNFPGPEYPKSRQPEHKKGLAVAQSSHRLAESSDRKTKIKSDWRRVRSAAEIEVPLLQ